MVALDNIVLKEGDVIQFNDVSDLDPPISERVALLKISEVNDVIFNIGVKIDDNTYIVQEL